MAINIQHPELVSTSPSVFDITEHKKNWTIIVKGLNAGHSILSANVTPSNITE